MSKLRGVKPEALTKRLKALIWGPAGSGKTTNLLQWPKPYLIDTERGAENDSYVKALIVSGGVLYQTSDFDEVLAEVKTLLTVKHDYQTVGIDPFTVIYNELVDRSAQELALKSGDPNNDGTEWGRHRALADRKIKRLLNLLLRLDMNVVITSHEKDKWDRKPGGKIEAAGKTFDCYPKLDYLFDLVLRVEMRGRDRVAVVEKSRLEGFVLGESFPFEFAEIEGRYGSELGREAVPVELATPDQVKQITHLVGALKVPEETTAKWMKKANADSYDELPKDAAEKVLAWLRERLDPNTVEVVS